MVPVFVGRVVFTAARTTIKGVVRPSHMAWPMVALPVVGAGLALLPQASNRILLAVVMVLLFVVANNGLVMGRRQARCRRAQVVMALEQIGGAPAQLAP